VKLVSSMLADGDPDAFETYVPICSLCVVIDSNQRNELVYIGGGIPVLIVFYSDIGLC
jgi:hypothetical protein